jgi:hypothetical protein
VTIRSLSQGLQLPWLFVVVSDCENSAELRPTCPLSALVIATHFRLRNGHRELSDSKAFTCCYSASGLRDMVVEYLLTQLIPSRARRARRWELWGAGGSVVKSARAVF